MTKEEMQELSSLEKEKAELAKIRMALQLDLQQMRQMKIRGSRIIVLQRRLNDCVARQMEVNSRLKELRRKRNEDVVAAKGVDATDPLSLIGHAYNLLHRLACEGVEIDDQEQAVIDGLQHYLAHVREE